jgi:sugar phosphate isomerase/epimerase
MTRLVGLAPLTVLELEPPEVVSCAAEAGFDFVGLRLVAATSEEAHRDIVGDTPLVRETERRIAHSGIPLFDIEVFRLKPDTRVADYTAALETGARLGAREALVTGQDADFSRLADRFGEFCDLAAEFGIAAGLEPMPWTEVNDIGAGERIVAAAARPHAGLIVDAIHVDRAHTLPRELAAIPREHLRYIQLCDAPAERPADLRMLIHQARVGRLMPGDGGIDLVSMLRALPRDLPVSVEVPMQELAKTMPALQRTRQMLARARAVLGRADVSEV